MYILLISQGTIMSIILSTWLDFPWQRYDKKQRIHNYASKQVLDQFSVMAFIDKSLSISSNELRTLTLHTVSNLHNGTRVTWKLSLRLSWINLQIAIIVWHNIISEKIGKPTSVGLENIWDFTIWTQSIHYILIEKNRHGHLF